MFHVEQSPPRVPLFHVEQEAPKAPFDRSLMHVQRQGKLMRPYLNAYYLI